jgi:hypothetical protein
VRPWGSSDSEIVSVLPLEAPGPSTQVWTIFAPGLELVRSPAKAQSGSPLHDQRFAEIDFTFDGAELPASQPGHLSEGAPPGAAPPTALPVQTVRPRALPGCSRAAAACGAARRPGGGGAGGAA